MKFDTKMKSVIMNSNNVCIMSHISSDGDGIGSCLALALALRAVGKNVTVVVEEELPSNYKWLPGSDMVVPYDGFDGNFDVVIVLDTGDEERIGKRIKLFKRLDNTINIDHHITNTNYAKFNHVDPKASAVGEIIYFLLKELGLQFNKDISTNIYVSIMTDTGSFRHSNTTAKCHMVVAELLKDGIDVSYISQMIYDNLSFERLRLTAEALNTTEVYFDGKLAISFITKEMMDKVGAVDDDCEGIIDLIRKLKGTEVAIFMRETDEGTVRVNLRSKTYVNVAKIAESFLGGGHERAAGCTITGNIDIAKKVLIEKIEF